MTKIILFFAFSVCMSGLHSMDSAPEKTDILEKLEKILKEIKQANLSVQELIPVKKELTLLRNELTLHNELILKNKKSESKGIVKRGKKAIFSCSRFIKNNKWKITMTLGVVGVSLVVLWMTPLGETVKKMVFDLGEELRTFLYSFAVGSCKCPKLDCPISDCPDPVCPDFIYNPDDTSVNDCPKIECPKVKPQPCSLYTDNPFAVASCNNENFRLKNALGEIEKFLKKRKEQSLWSKFFWKK
jgi:hypothetical protein